ncbi:MAG TPA: hypothetical protein VH592_18860, partial [Gemmataceae bacterium]
MYRIIELRWLRRRLVPTAATTRKTSARRRTTRPVLEGLESRIVPATQMFNPGDVPALIQDLQAASNDPTD